METDFKEALEKTIPPPVMGQENTKKLSSTSFNGKKGSLSAANNTQQTKASTQRKSISSSKGKKSSATLGGK